MAGDIAHAAFVREEGVNVLLSIWRLLKTPHIFVASYELRAAKTMNHAVVAVLPAASGRDMERRVIPKCDNEVNTLYASALHTFVNNVRSHIASGTGGQIINLTSEYITKPRHMDGMTYDCYTENIARGLLRRTPSDPHQGTGYTVNHFEKTHDQNGTLQQLLVDAYQFWLNDTEASLQRVILF
ncbi:unnamed protein product [Heligmosomoides polygyrus]|uniref:FAD_binding_3 domain-containing protein n=1 Tax=Heligmosomoides polygyrus TaxID=6339 RepID=A0A183FED7_HELPZ|nr:unnamed protein product [Heligmosomoides polygyrus]